MDGSADTTPAPLRAEEAALLEIAAAEETAILSLAKTRSGCNRPNSCSIGAVGHGPLKTAADKESAAERSVTAV
jgi:hypothetical protein